MRLPVPTNRLVAFTLAGAILTAVVAGGLAFPGVGFGQAGEDADSPGTPSDASQQLAGDAPTPNQGFTPAVQAQSGYEDEHEDEEHEEEEHEDEYEDDEHDEED